MKNYSYRGPVDSASPAGRALEEALKLAMEGCSPYPGSSTFIDAGTPVTDRQIRAAAKEGQSAVVVSADGSTRVLSPREILGKGRDAA